MEDHSEYIALNIQSIKQRMAVACQRSSRPVDSVRLLLATKTVQPPQIIEAFKTGEILIGENKVQELKDKFEALSSFPHETHFIGHLQTNKINDAIKYATCIQSVDRWPLAEKLNARLALVNREMDILIEVNTSGEESKHGCHPDDALALALQIKRLPQLHIKGLMTIGLFSDDEDAVRACFKTLKNIQLQMIDAGIPAHELSMGMSGDLEIAIEEGSTIIRVGTAIFGSRTYFN